MLSVKSFEFNPIQENTYIIYNDVNSCIILDPGCYFDEEKDALFGFIEQHKLKPAMLINTHCHLDHVFGNKAVAEKYSLTLQLHKNEEALLEFAPASGLMYSLPFDNYAGDLMFINEGDIVKLGDDELKVLLTPGHSPGSLSFYSAKDKFVITGDALFKNSVGRSDLPGGDHDQLIRSIKEKLLILPGDVQVYSGHGPVTTIGEERVNNPYLA